MRDASDMELLREYARQKSDPAFAELVRRHIGLVHSAALRHVGMAAQAEEITQAVFVILARKADGLRKGQILDAWLFETTRLTALRFLRGERRRQFREQEAYMQSVLQESTPDPVWQQLAPLLDEAMMRLGRRDREAVVLRFFKGRSLGEVAAALNIKEPAAQKRVSRALEKLRHFFAKRGVDSTASAIAEKISVHSVQAAPAALAKTVTAVALSKGAAASTSTLTLIKGALKIMAWSKAKTIVAVSVAVIVAASTTTTLVVQHRHPFVSRSSWAFGGYASPESAFETSTWAISKGDAQAYLASLTPAMQSQVRQRAGGKSDKIISDDDERDFAKITGYRIVKREVISKDEVWLEAYAQGLNQTTTAIFKRIGGEWKYAGKAKTQTSRK